MATRLLLGSRRRPILPAPGSTSGAYLRHRLAGGVRHLHVLPRTGTGSSWFGGSHPSPRAPRHIFGALLRDMLCSSFVCSSAVLVSGDKSEVSKPNLPPTGPLDHGSNNNREKRRCTDAIIGINLLIHDISISEFFMFLHIEFLRFKRGLPVHLVAHISCELCNTIGIGLRTIIYKKISWTNCSHLGGLLGGIAVEWFVGPYWNQHVSKDGMVVYEDKAPIVQLMNSKTAVPSCT
ncbi:hypothetical protein ACQ4PT_071896 [Festuca glaucescens]